MAMNNNQLYPFQRNRYYAGKLLTSSDFVAEQDYFNNKGRFLNSVMYGSGVVCGLGVISLDDLSILVESGVAIDGLGREVILDTSLVKKLSAIEGFDSLTSDKVSLCIRFKDTPAHSVYSVNSGQMDQEYEYSRMEEGAELFLLDSDKVEKHLDMETEFLTRNTLYTDEDFVLDISIPAMVSKGRDVKLTATVTKRSDADTAFTFHSTLQVPGFITVDNGQELNIDFDEIKLGKGEQTSVEYWVTVLESEMEDTLIILKSGSASKGACQP